MKKSQIVGIACLAVCFLSFLGYWEISKIPPVVGATDSPDTVSWGTIASLLAALSSGSGIAAVTAFLKNNHQPLDSLTHTLGGFITQKSTSEIVAASVAFKSPQSDPSAQSRFVSAAFAEMKPIFANDSDCSAALQTLAVAYVKSQYKTTK